MRRRRRHPRTTSRATRLLGTLLLVVAAGAATPGAGPGPDPAAPAPRGQVVPLGLSGAGHVEVRRPYDRDPGACPPGVPASAVRGVEAPLWTETLENSAHLEYLAFPRLPGVAEPGRSPAAAHDCADHRVRLAAQGPRRDALGTCGYHGSPQVPWPADG